MVFSWDIVILLLIFGLGIGIISTLLGEGGGVWYVSFMTLILLFPINISIDTSNFIILLTSAAGFFTYLKDKRINLKLALIYSTFSILGGLCSTIIFLFFKISNTLLRLAFATLIMIVGLNIIIRSLIERKSSKNKKENDEEPFNASFFEKFDYEKNLKIAIPLFFFAGFVSNLLGIGGGLINAPALNLLLGFPIHYSTSISTAIVFFTAIYNTVAKSLFGHIDFIVGIFLGAGSLIGAVIGARLSKKIPKLYLQLILSVVLISFGIGMIFLK